MLRPLRAFRDPDAQFELGQMFLTGDGGDTDVKRAFNLFRLSSEKGHAGAMAMFGDLLFQNGKTVRGLASLTAALQRSTPQDRNWIAGQMQKASRSRRRSRSPHRNGSGRRNGQRRPVSRSKSQLQFDNHRNMVRWLFPTADSLVDFHALQMFCRFR